MGNLLPNQINPNSQTSTHNPNHKLPQLTTSSSQICRKNFKFLTKLFKEGLQGEMVIWLAENINNDTQKFFVKVISKKMVFKNRRVQHVMNQLKILRNKGGNNYIVELYYAFQDYSSLYLVTEFIDGFTLEQVLKQHIFTQQQAKYVITSLISIIENIHQQKLCITDLNPRNIIVEKRTGRLKILQINNSMEIDSSYPSHVVSTMSQYSAPEILAMDQILAESDYYSLGLILYYIMKNKPAIPSNQDNRMQILSQRIIVVKSDLPEGWKPDAADFLVKLLIKNPELRLGRYGSFEISNHPWLQNYSWSANNDFQGIALSESYFVERRVDSGSGNEKFIKEDIDSSYEFQKLFEDYQFCLEAEEQSVSYDSILQQY